VGDSQGLTAFHAGLHHAALVVCAAFVAVLIAQVNFHPRDVIAVATQGRFNFASGPSRQRLVTSDVMSVLIWICMVHYFQFQGGLL